MRGWWAHVRAAVKAAGMTYDQWFTRARDVAEGGEESESGVDTSRPFAQSVWVHSAVNLIARTAASVPFLIRDAQERDVTSGPLVDLIKAAKYTAKRRCRLHHPGHQLDPAGRARVHPPGGDGGDATAENLRLAEPKNAVFRD